MDFDVLSIVQMIGGLALFIYGMTTMGKGLERAAGSKLEKTLEKMTGNVVTALLMGMVVTMVIQSSSATTVMVVGFVNAGIMTLKQSVGVILGANIGTTITAQILRLSGGEGSGSLFMDLLKPKNLAYIIVLVGVIIMMIAKKRRTRDIADIFTGFGILFIGMSVMEGAVAPLADLPQFADLFAAISNPVLGVLVGAGVTAITGSSITDKRLDTTVCGVVAGLVDTIDTTAFNAQLEAWFAEYQSDSAAEYNSLVSYMNSLKLQGNTQYDALEEYFADFKTEAQTDFDTWFEGLQDVLDENTAGNLLNMITALTARVDLIEAVIFNDITENPFLILFDDLSGVTTTGVWNESLQRIEC